MEMARNEDQSSVLVKQTCFEQPSPSPGSHGRHQGKPGRPEEEKENRRGPPAKSHVLKAAKHFMSPTISASMKMASPTPRSESVLVEKNEADKKIPLLQEAEFHCLDFETTTTPLSAKGSNFEVQNCSAAPPPYDPFVNYLSPRPRFLRYNPSRRLEVLRRMESHVGEEDGVEESLDSEKKPVEEEMETSSSQIYGSSSTERSDSISCQSEVSGDQTVQEVIGLPCSTVESKGKVSDDLIAPQEVETSLLMGVEERKSQEVGVEGLDMQSHVGEEDGVEESLDSEKKPVEEEMVSSSSQIDGFSSMERSDSISCQSEVSGDQTVQEAIGLPCSTVESKDADDKVSDDLIAPQEVETSLLMGVEEPTSREVGVEDLELEDEDDEEEEERSWWRPSSVLESLLVLSLLILAPFYVSYVCSTSGVTFGDGGVGGGLLEIHDPLPHPSRFSFDKLIGNNQFSSPFFGAGVTSSSRFVNSSTDMVDGDSYMFDAPNLGLEEMDASFYLKDAAYDANTLLEEANFLVKSDLSLIGLLDMEERLATQQTAVVNVEELPDIMEADEKQYSEVQENITGVGSYDEASKIEVPFFEEPRQFEMVLPSVMQGSIDSIDDQERWLATQQTVLETVEEFPDIMEADDEKQYSEVQEIITGVGSYDETSKIEVPFFEEPLQFEMVLPSVMQGSIDSIDEQPLSEKLSVSDIVSLSMEPMCNTYGITSYYGTSLRLEENGNHLFPPNARNYSFLSSVPTAVFVLAAILSSFVCLKCMKVRNSSPSTANASTIGRGTSKTQTPKYEVSSSTLSSTRKNSRRLSMSSSTNQERWLSSSLSTADSTSYGSITIHKEVVLKQEVVSTPVRRSSRLLNRTPPPYLL